MFNAATAARRRGAHRKDCEELKQWVDLQVMSRDVINDALGEALALQELMKR